MGRIDRGGVKPTGRTDVPPSLERLLATAMSRRVQQRPATVMELVRGFQQVQAELGLPQTPADVAVEAWAVAMPSPDGDRTMVRDLQPPSRVGRRRRARRPVQGGVAATGSRSVGTVHRTGSMTQNRRRSRRTVVWVSSVAAVVVAALAVTTVLAVSRSGTGAIPTVSDVRASSSTGSVTFRWSDPGSSRATRTSSRRTARRASSRARPSSCPEPPATRSASPSPSTVTARPGPRVHSAARPSGAARDQAADRAAPVRRRDGRGVGGRRGPGRGRRRRVERLPHPAHRPRRRDRLGALGAVRSRGTREHPGPAAQHRGRGIDGRPLGAPARLHGLQRRRDQGHRRQGRRGGRDRG